VHRAIPLIAALAAIPAPLSAQAPAPATLAPPLGVWLDGSKRAGIDIEPCGDRLCGTVVWLKEPRTPDGKRRTDIHNSRAELRARPLCGLQIMGNFTPNGPGRWNGGWIYDPANGSTYKAYMRTEPDGTLTVRGYVGIPFMGRSETWTRPAAPLPRCDGGPA
jgi:uncharacterized protein (DUF2147 family)